MKNQLHIIAFLLYPVVLCAQQQVIATSGNAIQNTSGSISWTIGEPVITTLASQNQILNQGFQQGPLKAIQQSVTLTSDPKISVWPNPTRDWIILSVENPEDIIFQLFDIKGNILQSKALMDLTSSINIGYLASGTYLVKVLKGKTELKTLTIIKQ